MPWRKQKTYPKMHLFGYEFNSSPEIKVLLFPQYVELYQGLLFPTIRRIVPYFYDTYTIACGIMMPQVSASLSPPQWGGWYACLVWASLHRNPLYYDTVYRPCVWRFFWWVGQLRVCHKYVLILNELMLSTTQRQQSTNNGNPRTWWAMEGLAREVRWEGKDGRGGDERDKSPTIAMAKLLPLLCPPLKK